MRSREADYQIISACIYRKAVEPWHAKSKNYKSSYARHYPISIQSPIPRADKISSFDLRSSILYYDKRGLLESYCSSREPVLHTRTKHKAHRHSTSLCSQWSDKWKDQSGVYTDRREMLADGPTKSLSHVKFLNFIKQLRMD